MKKNNSEYKLLEFCLDATIKPTITYDFYHYTSPEGLEGILDKNNLWFTRYDCLNDYTEREYIFEVFTSVCERLKNNGQISSDFYNEIVKLKADNEEILSFPNDRHDYKSFNCDYYICCFSKNQDSLPMWNYYTKGNRFEGYNIKFSMHLVDNYKQKYGNNIEIEAFSVIYDSEEQEQKIEEAILILFNLLEENVDMLDIKSCLLHFLKKHSFLFKKECFKHEEEVRIVITLPKGGNEYIPIHYRIVKGNFVPYIELEFEKDFVYGITIGPLINMEITKNILSEYLAQNNYVVTDIKMSDIPIRY